MISPVALVALPREEATAPKDIPRDIRRGCFHHMPKTILAMMFFWISLLPP